MNKILKIYTAVCITVLSAEDKTKIDSKKYTSVRQTFRFDQIPDDSSYTILIDNIESSIAVSGKEGSGVLINVEKKVFGITEKEIQIAHEIANTTVRHFEKEKLIHIQAANPNNFDYNYETLISFKLPKKIKLNFKLQGGDVNISEIVGKCSILTLGGNISVTNFNGSFDGRTEGGSVSINFLNGLLRTHSSGGHVKIKDSKGKLYSSTVSGDLFLDNLTGIMEAQSSGGSIFVNNLNGEKIALRASGGKVLGTNISGNCSINGFGGNIELFNISGNANLDISGGSIEIDSLEGVLKCDVASGDIHLKETTGIIECMTSSGDIILEYIYSSLINDHSADLITHNGNLKVLIPKGLPLNIQSIIHRSNSEKNLNSEIPLVVESKKKKVLGTKIINGGTFPINLETFDGSITIKEY